MNLVLTNGRVKKNGENIKEIQEIIESLKTGQPVPQVQAVAQAVAIPEGSNIDVGQL